MWTGGVPLFVHLIVILVFVAGTVLVQKDRMPFVYSAAILACVAAAYATRPLLEAEILMTSLRIEGLAPFLFWLLVLEVPSRIESPFWHRLALACTGFCAVAGAWALVSDVFVMLPRAWGPRYFQFWDLSIPLGLLAVVILCCRSLLAREELGLDYAKSLLPMLFMLSLEAAIPGVAEFAELHRPVFSGFLTAALMTLPVLLVRESWRAERSGWQANSGMS